MNLIIDIGNSLIKLAVFEQDILVEKIVCQHNNYQLEINFFLVKYNNLKNIVVSNVGNIEIKEFLEANSKTQITFIDRNFKFPFTNLYKSPQTLGVDRMILSAGAVLKFPNCNRLVIDAGTCITYDFVDHENNYHGGAISPGISLRYKSLNNYTAKLPLLEKQYPESSIGSSTNDSIHSGVINGVAFEIDGFISSYIQDNENFIIILTGGDAVFLAKRLKNTIFANSNFLLESLNQTYQYNLK